uniref:Uncharacterized protein LOC113791356 n=1 Tax=Dermatophagoides pteronyssinus TaxID=6956 RepID=A0A6P6XVP0_DERPT|nr:uncharacterized protein LOC113791356 [Dermatophagoides pteronyssinus]
MITVRLNDYEQQNISWTFSSVKRAILITLIVWLTILFLLIIVIWPQNDYLISIEIFNEIVHSKRNDFIVIETIISKITEFLMKYCQYDDCELLSKYRNNLIRFYQKSYFIANISYRIFSIGIFPVYFVAIVFVFHLYQCNQINLMKLIMTIIFFSLYSCHCIFIIGDSFKILSCRNKKLFWYQFHTDYVYLFSETYKFNLTLRYILLFIELLSKSLVIICLLFYSHQTEMHIQNTLITLIFMTVFISINILNFRIAHIPSYNRISTKIFN